MNLSDLRDTSWFGIAPIVLAVMLLSCSPDPPVDDLETPLSIEVVYDAAAAGDLEELQAISLDSDFKSLLTKANNASPGLLHIVQDCEIAQFLVAHGVDPDTPNDFGYTPLHYASAAEGNVSLFDCLLELGASLSKRTVSPNIDLNIPEMEEAISKYPDVKRFLKAT